MNSLGLRLPSPIQKVSLKAFVGTDFFIWLKREDLIHPDFGGNKWRKLKYNLAHFKTEGFKTLVTFGGPFSNHLAATAALCQVEKIPAVGIVRGTMLDPNNPTLNKAKAQGMILHHVPKAEYKLKQASAFINALINNYENTLVIPEGGSNALALIGVEETMAEVFDQEAHFDKLVIAAGTGMTAAGIIKSKKSDQELIVINCLKNPELNATIEKYLEATYENWTVIHDGHFGGFAKVNHELITFINKFIKETGIVLDPIYNAKAMMALISKIKAGKIGAAAKVLFILTGGLQGVEAYNYTCRDESLILGAT